MTHERTEAATPRRRAEARRKGQVAKSVEVNSAAMLLAAFWLLGVIGPRSYEALSELMRRSFTALSSNEFTFNTLFAGGSTTIILMLQAVAPLILGLTLVGVISNAAQVGLMFSQETLKPDPNRINPLTGFKRLFSSRGLVELLKSLIKLSLTGFVIYVTLRDNYSTMAATSRMTVFGGVSTLAQLGLTVGFRVAIVMVVIAAADYLFQRREFEKNLRMTKQEVKEEMKQYENPELKRRIRARQREMAMSRMMAAVPQADVVITNPTHIAIALSYEKQKMQAPKVIAKGQRLVAERIKEKARQHRVPTVENKPLARTLFKTTEIGQEIPIDLYQAVAEVLAFVYRLKPRRTAATQSAKVG